MESYRKYYEQQEQDISLIQQQEESNKVFSG